MNKFAPILMVLGLTIAACNAHPSPQPNSVLQKTNYSVLQGANAENPLPLASPVGEQQFDLKKETLKTTKDAIETAVRASLKDSSINSVEITLKTPETLVGNDQLSASRHLTPGSPVWFVTVSGDINWTEAKYIQEGKLYVPTGKTMRVLVSAEDGRIISRELVSPQFVQADPSNF